MVAKKPAPKRKLVTPKYKSFRLSKRIKHPAGNKLPSSWQLIKQSFRVMKRNWRFFVILIAIYGVLSALFIRTSSETVDVTSLKDTFNSLIGGNGNLAGNIALFGVLVGRSASFSDIAGTYQIIMALVLSLALIYGLRHVFSGLKSKPSVKKALYEGMGPIIPFLLVLAVIGLQLIPLSIGSSLYATVIANGLAVTVVEKAVWLIFLFLLILLSLYMLASSVFALYIVTLPGMTPLKSLRSARELVRFRRWTVIRKLLALPLLILAILGLLVIPLISYLPRFAEITFFILTLAVLPVVHTYIYTLYRKLL